MGGNLMRTNLRFETLLKTFMYLPIISRLFDISFTISSRSEAIFHGKFCTNDKIIRLAEIQCCLLFEGALQKKEKINHDMSLFVVWT